MKYRYLSIIFLILVLSIGAVCAQDNDAVASDVVAAGSDDVISVDNNANILDNEISSGSSVSIDDNNYNDYFSENGTILENANISDNDTIILGNINDKVFDIDRPLNITSNGTPINNVEIILDKGSDNSIIQNLNITNDGLTAIHVLEANNISIIANEILIEASGNYTDVAAIYASLANNLRIEENAILCNIKSESLANNKVIWVEESDDLTISRNIVVAEIPSLPVDWTTGNVYSEGISLGDCNNVNFTRNIILVKSSGYTGEYDTIYGVHATGNNVSIVGNVIGVLDAPYGYAVVISGEEFVVGYNLIYSGIDVIELINKTIINFTDSSYNDDVKSQFYENLTSSIDIKTIIDDLISNITTPYACGINVEGNAFGEIELNMVTTAAVSSYGIYTSNWNGDVIAEMAMNFILGAGDTVFGMSLSGSESLVENSAMALFGNYTTGIASTMNNINITSVAIDALGSDEGTPAGYDSMGIETTGVHIVSGDASITNSYVNTTGKYAVDFEGEGQVTDNELYAKIATGDFAVDYSQDANILVANNTPEMELDYKLTNDTFYIYFDEEGFIREQIETDNLTFIGEFSNLVDIIFINKPIHVLSDNATLNNITMEILSGDVVVDGFNFTGELSGLAVMFNDNIQVMNNNFIVKGLNNYSNMVITIFGSNNVSLENNTIIFGVETNDTFSNYAVFAEDSDNLTIVGNNVTASLPARSINWTTGQVYSQGVFLDNCDNAVFDSNTIGVKSNDQIDTYDTIYAVNIKGDNATVTNNLLGVVEAPYGYALVITGENFNITKNMIFAGENGTYSCGIDVESNSNGVIDSNLIDAVANDTAYAIYTANWAGDVKANITNNYILADANSPFGLSLSGSEALVENNSILAQGNYTTGIASAVGNVTINNNTIVANGSNVGTPLGYDSMGVETTGVHIAGGNAIVTNNNVTTTGEFAVDAKGTGEVTDNYLVASEYTGDASVDNVVGDTIVANNTPAMQRAIISSNDVVMYYKNGTRYVAVLTDQNGKPLSNKTVTLTINGASYARTTDENGTVSLAINLNSGNYTASAFYVGDDTNSSIQNNVTVLTTVTGEDVVKVFRNGTQYYATFLDGQGNPLENGTEVTFNINGVMYKRYVNGSEGKARLNINLPQGEYVISAINPINGEMHANNITVLSTIANNTDLVKYYRNDSQYVVTIIGDDGKPVGAGENVTFNINGVLYTRQTNESGQVKLNINLPQGNYTITAEYKGCKVANNITVLPILRAKDLVKKYGTSDQFIAYLVDGQGNPYPGQNVTFNIHGVMYERTTDYDGRAALNIKLDAAVNTYTITSSYMGCTIVNSIKIEP